MLWFIILFLVCFVYFSFFIFVVFEMNHTIPNMLKCVRPAPPFFQNFFTKKKKQTNFNFLGKLTSGEVPLFQPLSSSTLETIILNSLLFWEPRVTQTIRKILSFVCKQYSETKVVAYVFAFQALLSVSIIFSQKALGEDSQVIQTLANVMMRAPVMTYTRRLRPKGVPFSVFRYMKSEGISLLCS